MSRIPADFNDEPGAGGYPPLAEPLPTPPPAPPPPPRMVEVLPAAPAVAEEERVARAALQLVDQAKAFQVTDVASYERAGQMIDALKTKRKDVLGWFEPMVDAAHKAWKALTSKRAGVTDPLDEAIEVLSGRYALFARAERQRAEEERQREERAAQERDRERLRREAEELDRIAEAARQEAAGAATPEEIEILSAEAEQTAQAAAATRIAAAETPRPVLPIQSSIARVKGPAVVENWTYQVTNLMELVKAVAEGKVKILAVEASASYLTKVAKADKSTARIPGVRVYDAGSVRASRPKR